MSAIRYPLTGLLVLALAPGLSQAAIPPAHTPGEVLDRMEAVRARYSEDDGIARFNDLYYATTLKISNAIESGRFDDPQAMRGFLVRFANFYFAALGAFEDGRSDYPKAWRPLFTRHTEIHKHRGIQFAMAGMEAHIARDLPVALRDEYLGLGEFPSESTAVRKDYGVVDRILAETYQDLKSEYCPTRRDCPLTDTGLSKVIHSMRDQAWNNGRRLWKARRKPETEQLLLRTIDRSTQFMAEALLSLWGTWPF